MRLSIWGIVFSQFLVVDSLENAAFADFALAIPPVHVVLYIWYCWILAAFALLSIFLPYADGICRKNPWNWEYDTAKSKMPEKNDLRKHRGVK